MFCTVCSLCYTHIWKSCMLMWFATALQFNAEFLISSVLIIFKERKTMNEWLFSIQKQLYSTITTYRYDVMTPMPFHSIDIHPRHRCRIWFERNSGSLSDFKSFHKLHRLQVVLQSILYVSARVREVNRLSMWALAPGAPLGTLCLSLWSSYSREWLTTNMWWDAQKRITFKTLLCFLWADRIQYLVSPYTTAHAG